MRALALALLLAFVLDLVPSLRPASEPVLTQAPALSADLHGAPAATMPPEGVRFVRLIAGEIDPPDAALTQLAPAFVMRRPAEPAAHATPALPRPQATGPYATGPPIRDA